MSNSNAVSSKVIGNSITSDASNRPAGGNVGLLLTRSNPERAVGDAIDQLVAERLHWENNELATPMKRCMDCCNTATH